MGECSPKELSMLLQREMRSDSYVVKCTKERQGNRTVSMTRLFITRPILLGAERKIRERLRQKLAQILLAYWDGIEFEIHFTSVTPRNIQQRAISDGKIGA